MLDGVAPSREERSLQVLERQCSGCGHWICATATQLGIIIGLEQSNGTEEDSLKERIRFLHMHPQRRETGQMCQDQSDQRPLVILSQRFMHLQFKLRALNNSHLGDGFLYDLAILHVQTFCFPEAIHVLAPVGVLLQEMHHPNQSS